MIAAQRFRAGGLAALASAGLAAAWLLPVSRAWGLAPDLGHAWAVPVLMAYLWWERWGERPAARAGRPLGRGWWLAAFGVAALQLPLRLLLTPFPLWPALLGIYTMLFIAVALAGAWLLAGRPGLRWLGGPLILVVSTLPAPSLIESAVIIPLRTGMAALAAEISNLLGHPALAMGTSIRLGAGWVGIDEACGGIRSLQACLMIGLFFGAWYRFRWDRRLALVVAGIGAALLGNFGRVLFLSLRASAGAHAIESAHDLAGWLAMGFSLVLTGWMACRWAGYRWPEQRNPPRPAPAESTVPRAPAAPVRPTGAPAFSAGWLWLASVVGVFAVNEAATRWWYARGEIRRASGPQWTAVLPAQTRTFQPQDLSEAAHEMLRPDSFVAGRWQAAPDLYVSGYYIEWRRGQVARFVPFLHNPTVCLPLAGCELIQSLAPITVSWSGGSIPFFAYKFRRVGGEILVAFTIWDPARGRPMEKPPDLQSWRQWWKQQWTEVAEARQHQPAQLLTVTVPWSENAPALAQQVLNELVRSAPSSLVATEASFPSETK